MTDQTKIEYGAGWAKVHNLPDPMTGVGFVLDDDGEQELRAHCSGESIYLLAQDYADPGPVVLAPDQAEALAAALLAFAHKVRGQR